VPKPAPIQPRAVQRRLGLGEALRPRQGLRNRTTTGLTKAQTQRYPPLHQGRSVM